MRERVSRVRALGTVVTVPTSGEDRIAAVKAIVANKQYAKIDGCMVDLFSANYIVQVYDALSRKNQANYRDRPVQMMADMAFKLVKKVGAA